MKTRQQAAEDFADTARPTSESYRKVHDAFLSGCEHADKEHRDFYLLVREMMADYVNVPFIDDDETMKVYKLTEKIREHLAAFNEREQQSLPFKD